MGRYRDWVAGGVSYVVAFAGVFAASGSVLFAVPLGLAFGIGVGLTTSSLLPAGTADDDDAYAGDVQRRVHSVTRTTNEVSELAQQVRDPDSRAALLQGCRVVSDLLTLAQTRDPDNMATTAAKVGQYVGSVKEALVVHLQIETNPGYFAGAEQLLVANRQGFQSFDAFAHRSVQQLNEGEAMSLRATLRTLEPMTLPDGLSEGAR